MDAAPQEKSPASAPQENPGGLTPQENAETQDVAANLRVGPFCPSPDSGPGQWHAWRLVGHGPLGDQLRCDHCHTLVLGVSSERI
jgi:hypothetical protein